MKPELEKISKHLKQKIYDYMKSEGPGGMRVINAFMDEFLELSKRSPQDDPTNIKNHMAFLLRHIKNTWDESIEITDDGTIRIGICDDETLGFDVERSQLKHKPTPVVWTVYLIRGIGGRYAFVNPRTYFMKHGAPMPPQYSGGFLISKGMWNKEGWEQVVGPFELFEHPSSGAPPIPFFRNVLERIDINSIVNEALEEAQEELDNAIN
jgi:hypothetical protein